MKKNLTKEYKPEAGYETLANAIILQAVKDYRMAIRHFDLYTMGQLRHFFHSQCNHHHYLFQNVFITPKGNLMSIKQSLHLPHSQPPLLLLRRFSRV